MPGHSLLSVKPQTRVKTGWCEVQCPSLARGFACSPSSGASVAGCLGVQRGSFFGGVWYGRRTRRQLSAGWFQLSLPWFAYRIVTIPKLRPRYRFVYGF